MLIYLSLAKIGTNHSEDIMKLPINIPYINNKQLIIEGDDSEGILLYSQKTNSFSFYLQKLVIDLCLSDTKKYTILNAGANLGLVCLPISLFCDKVYAFEPLPRIFEYLKRNIENNKIQNIEAFNCALGDAEDILQMEPYGWDKTPKDSGHSVIVNRSYNYGSLEQYVPKTNAGIIDVKAKTIDSYEFKDLDILLLDTEGYEPYVIEGSKKTIQQHKPYIIIEHEVGHVQCRHMTSKSIIDNILKLGYEDVKIIIKDVKNHENYNLLSIEYDKNDFLTILKLLPCVDLLFIPKDRKQIQ